MKKVLKKKVANSSNAVRYFSTEGATAWYSIQVYNSATGKTSIQNCAKCT